mgnify:CR=1 FL=1
MTKKIKAALLLLIISLTAFSGGVYVGLEEVFPFKVYKVIWNAAFDKPVVKPALREVNVRLSQFEAFDSKSDFVFVGDSLIERGEWAEFFPKLSLKNRGVGGDTTLSVLNRIDDVKSLSPKYVFLSIGFNDIRAYRSTENILATYTLIVNSLRESGINVIIQSTIQCSPKRSKDWSQHISELNNALEKFASEKEIRFIDLGVLSDDTGLSLIYSQDGVHLNGTGYKEWVKIISPVIYALNTD